MGINMCCAFVDSLAEGITVLNTKMIEKVKVMEKHQLRMQMKKVVSETGDEFKSFGNFAMARASSGVLVNILGGWFASSLSIHTTFII